MSSKHLAFVAVLVLGAAFGCHAPTHEEPLSVDEPVYALNVDVGSGDLHLIGSDVSGANVLAKVEGDSNHLGYELSEGRLSLFEDCHEQPCAVNITAMVPAAIPFEIHTGSGDVRIEGALDQLHVNAGSGDVQAVDITGLDLQVKTGSGDIDLSVLDPTDQVSVRAGSGDVYLAVPAGSYRVNVDTGSGDRSVQGIANDAEAAASIAIDTGSGDVRVRGRSEL
jgi:hypothetical protein